MPNCDWGRPCICSDCQESNNEYAQKEGCWCGKSYYNSITNYKYDRKGLGYYNTTGYCKEHYEIYQNNKKKEDEKKKKEYEKRDIMMKSLYETFLTRSKELPYKEVPIKYIDNRPKNIPKYPIRSPITTHTDSIRTHLDSEDLKIKKVGRYWKCCKNRIDLFHELDMGTFYVINDPRR